MNGINILLGLLSRTDGRDQVYLQIYLDFKVNSILMSAFC